MTKLLLRPSVEVAACGASSVTASTVCTRGRQGVYPLLNSYPTVTAERPNGESYLVLQSWYDLDFRVIVYVELEITVIDHMEYYEVRKNLCCREGKTANVKVMGRS
ncbi:hypothetical protein F5J12DRAFT_781274 [Pisolithus orientalis]|uniref:uncharacterized protein n=1 Tax=Pisolithus orientalis TaxID=936130 RepID=UPI0022245D51|nr:uncharacterized protein F5J12DRAFT_781274 [Pisolithus orientalis]KAI6015255.1 hypothetical protein F5J12DRAFT_781274 [Pisolithus orientalis]